MKSENTPNSQSTEPSVDCSEEMSPSTSSASSEARSVNEEAVPTEVVEEALKQLPPEQRGMMKSVFLSMERMSSSNSSQLAKRINSEHITQTLNNLEKENERDFKKSQAGEVTKRLGMGAVLVLVLMVFGYAGLTKDKDLAEKVIIAGISGLGGYGAGVATRRKEQ